MQDQKAKAYLRTQIKTASKEQLVVMLYDGAIRFCEHSKIYLTDKDYEAANNALLRVQRIVMELMGALNPDVDVDFSGKMMSLYQYINSRLVEANLENSSEKIEEVVNLLRPLRDAWSEAALKLRKDRSAAVAQADVPGSRSGISIQG